ncbi:MAG: hypothetical protein E7301_10445 [Butyrivibrio sp.]|nr:hypothetical protein [Butyrivibrio sp.]
MSEENLNNTEETAALFVAKQKKKEADKKAAQEQAQINLKAEEASRMEAEIAQRKKKAIQRKIITIAVAVVAVIVTFFIIINLMSSVSKIGKYDYAGMEFDTEFTPGSGDHQTTIHYPGALYTSVTESDYDTRSRLIEFVPEKPEYVTTKVTLEYMTVEEQTNKMGIKDIAFISPSWLMDALKDDTQENVNKFVAGAAITDLEVVDPTAENPGKYFYSCSFTSGENSGEAASWYEFSEDGVLQMVSVFGMAPGEDPADGKTVCDAFVANNADDAHLVVGMNPLPQGTALDGYIEFPDIDFRMKVPKDTFYPNTVGTYMTFSDANGAAIIVIPELVEGGFGNYSFDQEQLMEACKERSKTRLSQLVQGISDHEPMIDEYTSETGYDFSMDYTFTQNGIQYIEIFLMTPFSDTVHGNDYFVEVEMIYPYANRDLYAVLFTDSVMDLLGVE